MSWSCWMKGGITNDDSFGKKNLFNEGDGNTKYFCAIMKNKKKGFKSWISRVTKGNGSSKLIRSIRHYYKLFKLTHLIQKLFTHILKVWTPLTKMPAPLLIWRQFLCIYCQELVCLTTDVYYSIILIAQSYKEETSFRFALTFFGFQNLSCLHFGEDL